MKKTTALWTLSLLISFCCAAAAAEPANRSGLPVPLNPMTRLEAAPQAAAGGQASGPQWKSRDEYDAYAAMAKETDADKQLSLAQAFIQKFPTSDFISGAYTVEMTVYAKENKTDDAVGAARKVLGADPNNLDALAFVSYVFPFTYKDTDPDKDAKLSKADSDAHHGLDVLSKLQKPANVSQQDYTTYVTAKRALFNSTIGFVALQKKDYANAINSLKAAATDNPTDYYTVYRLAIAELSSTPPDNDDGIWYYARAIALGKAKNDPNVGQWDTYLKQKYVAYHGTDTGFQDLETQAATQPNPPDGFKIAAKPEAPKQTGNQVIDAFNTMTYPLTLGGSTAQTAWDSLKGQAYGSGGTVASVEKGTDAGTYLVRIAILDTTKSEDKYDVELKDSTQPNVKNLQKGDLLTFKGNLDSYVASPSLILTLVGEVTSDLPDKPQPNKPPARHSTTHASPSTGR